MQLIVYINYCIFKSIHRSGHYHCVVDPEYQHAVTDEMKYTEVVRHSCSDDFLKSDHKWSQEMRLRHVTTKSQC